MQMRVQYFPYFTLASDIRSSKIQNCCCFENANGLWFVYKTKLTLEIKRKHLKDNHLEISNIYSSFILVQTHYNLKNIAFVLVFRGLFACRRFAYFCFCFCHSNVKYISPPLANGAERRSGSKPGARVLIPPMQLFTPGEQSCSPSLRSSGRNVRLWDNPVPEARNPG